MKIPARPPEISKLIEELRTEGTTGLGLLLGVPPTPGGRYRHWDVLRRLEPPDGLTARQWWLAIKTARISQYRKVPLQSTDGENFRYMVPDVAHEMLHSIDTRASGSIEAVEPVTNPTTRDRYLVRSLIEEAITSSQLEGAATTRHVAKEMLRTGRAPRDKSERMIANNYQAMLSIRELPDKLSPSTVCHLHRIVTEGTLETPEASGRLRRDSDGPIVVQDRGTDVVLHEPPPPKTLPQRLEGLCRFANSEDRSNFIHPVVRSILLHFWLAYDHPFVDGNGRTARALFYWSLARQGYWLAEFTSISRIIKNSPAKYARAFLYTETDDNDLTYFILNQLRVFVRAVDDLYKYLERKSREASQARSYLEGLGPVRFLLNHRQLDIVRNALKNPDGHYTFRTHRNTHRISYQTARTDLSKMADLKLLELAREGRQYVFYVPPDLQTRLERLAKRRRKRPRK